MEKFQHAMEGTLLPIANRLSESRLLKAISGGFGMLLPVVIAGAIASLLAGLSFDPYQQAIAAVGLKSVFTFVTTYTTNMLALYAAFAIGCSMAEQQGCEKQSRIMGVVTLLVFLLLIPTGVGKGDAAVPTAIDTTYFGAAGLFAAIILGLAVPSVYAVFVRNNVSIKMPDGVPPFVSNGFAAIIPTVFVIALFCVVRQLCALTPFGSFSALIYSVLRVPLASLGQSPLTFALFCLVCNLLWFFGIHGGMVVMPFITMLYMPAALENLDAFAAGTTVMPNVITNTWWFTFVQLGGSGGIIGLALLMSFAAKSARYRSLGRLALVPAVCGISEPVVFGTPLMLNVIMFVPMIVTPLVTFVLSYVLTIVGVLPVLNGMQLTTGTPVLVSGFLTGGWQVMVWQAVLVALQAAIYLPFFRILDKEACEEEVCAASEGDGGSVAEKAPATGTPVVGAAAVVTPDVANGASA